MEQYLQMLSDSLTKKSKLLDELSEKTKEQERLIAESAVDWDAFDHLVEEKGTLIAEVQKLEEGFDALYGRIREGLSENRSKYRQQISGLQQQIMTVTEKSTSLMAMEERNKAQITMKFSQEKDKIKQSRVSTRVATNYYRNMSKINYIDPQLMDRKK